MIELLRAIKIAINGKDLPLGVNHYGYFHTWNSSEDSSWLKYKRAREVISSYRMVEKFLRRIRWI
jgi:hypothetical protein